MYKKPCNLRSGSALQRKRNCIVYFGTESMSSITHEIWEIFPCKIKNAKPLDICKEKCGQQIKLRKFMVLSRSSFDYLWLVRLFRFYTLANTAWKVSVSGVILVRIFPHSDWMRRDTPYISVFSPYARKCGSGITLNTETFCRVKVTRSGTKHHTWVDWCAICSILM